MKPILASKIINALGEPKKGIMGYQGGSIADSKLNQTRIDIINAKKFILSDNLTERASEASMSKPSVLLDMLENGIPQFDNIWIEWNENVRQEFYKNHHIKNGKEYNEVAYYPDKVAYHISKFTDELGDSYFLYEAWFQVEDEKEFACPPICFTLRNQEAESFNDLKAKNDLLQEMPNSMMVQNEEQLFAEQFKKAVKLLAPWYAMEQFPKQLQKRFVTKKGFEIDDKGFKIINKFDKSHEFDCLKEIARRTETAQSCSMHWMIPKQQFIDGYTQSELTAYTENSLDVLVGDARFIIALFGLINAEITRHEQVEPDSKLIYTQFGKRIPRNSYKVLHVDLSDNQVRKRYKSKYTGIKKRQHERRGHWRHFKNGKKTWIRNCLAGDPNLGFVSKDYNFKKED